MNISGVVWTSYADASIFRLGNAFLLMPPETDRDKWRLVHLAGPYLPVYGDTAEKAVETMANALSLVLHENSKRRDLEAYVRRIKTNLDMLGTQPAKTVEDMILAVRSSRRW